MLKLTRNAFRGAVTAAPVKPPVYVGYYEAACVPSTSEIRGYETLARQQTSLTGRLLRPAEFLEQIPPAERPALDLEMLRQACKLQVQIREALPPNTPLPYISVNLTPETLALPDLPARFKAILQAHGVQARHIKPEILELPFPDAHAATIKQNIRLLHEAGHMNVLDDFLTGSSDFARLRELRPYLAGVKINHCFQELSPKEQAETLRELRSMGMEITMERVADPHDYDVAIQAGSNLAQGHRYFKPMDARAAAIMYASSAQASVNSQQTFDDEPDEWQPDAHGVAEPVTL